VADISPLAKLSNLQSLELHGTQISDVLSLTNLFSTGQLVIGLEEDQLVKLFPQLLRIPAVKLRLNYIEDVSAIAKVSNLQSLDLSGSHVADVSPLAKLSNLQSLNLSITQVTDISPLVNLSNLQSLKLNFTQVADVSVLDHLTGLTIHFG
jgi:internalin A